MDTLRLPCSAAGSGSDAMDMSPILPTLHRQNGAIQNHQTISAQPCLLPTMSDRSPLQDISVNSALELLSLNESSFKETLLLIDPEESRNTDKYTALPAPWLGQESQLGISHDGLNSLPEVALSTDVSQDSDTRGQKEQNELLVSAPLTHKLNESPSSIADTSQLHSSMVSSYINPPHDVNSKTLASGLNMKSSGHYSFQRNRPNLPLNSPESSIDPSETSSPFVLQPDISAGKSGEDIAVIKLQTYQSLMTPKKHSKTVEISSPGYFQNSVNNTVNQLDDTDIISVSKRSEQSETQSILPETSLNTPWRKFRSRKRDVPFSKELDTANFAEEATVHNGSKVDELKKQIVGFKVEIRLMKNFVQRIILNSLSDVDYSAIWSEESKKSDELERLKAEYDEVYKLNEDLYRNLEIFQNEILNKENIINENQDCVRQWGKEIDQMLQKFLEVSSSQKQADDIRTILKIPVTTTLQINDKLAFLLLEIASTAHAKTYPLPPTTSSEVNSRVPDDFNTKVLAIDAELASYVERCAEVEEALRSEVKNSQQLRSNYREIIAKFNRLVETVEMDRIQLNMDTSVEKVRNENERLVEINRSVDSKLEEYQKVIDRLQEEVNALKAELEGSINGHNLVISTALSRSASLKEINDQYDRLQRESSRAIASLTSQLQTKKQEVIALKTDKLKFDKLSYDLEVAIGKQRILAAEKIKLTYTIESLTDDKVALQANIANLTEKVTNLTVAKNENQNKDSVQRKFNILEYQFNDFLSTDVDIFGKLLQSFEKIADDVSLQEPKRKIEWLTRMVENGAQPVDISESESKRLLKYHKSVLEYFSRAVGIIVHDHVKILLKEGETERQKSEYINKLQNRIDELTRLNDSISEDDTPIGAVTPKTNLRLEELTNRWKAEREARVYDNKALKKRLAELESENATLRKELTRSKG